MRTLLLDPPPSEVADWLERRRRLGQDGYDEVWEGVYHVAPMARGQHGWLQSQVDRILGPLADRAGLTAVGPFNLGADAKNFRVPDLGVLRDFDPQLLYVPTAAIVVEVVSPDDETYDKFPFYADRGVEEIIVVDPDERRVRMYTRADDGYVETERNTALGVDVAHVQSRLRWATG